MKYLQFQRCLVPSLLVASAMAAVPAWADPLPAVTQPELPPPQLEQADSTPAQPAPVAVPATITPSDAGEKVYDGSALPPFSPPTHEAPLPAFAPFDAPAAVPAPVAEVLERPPVCSGETVAPVATWHPHASLWATQFQYTNPWNLSKIQAVSLVAGANAPGGGWWLASAQSQTGLRYQTSDFRQDHNVVGGYLRWGLWQAEAVLGQAWTTASDTDGARLGQLGIGWQSPQFAAHLSASAVRYSARTTAQIDPKLSYFTRWLDLSLAGQVQTIDDNGQTTDWLGSAAIAANWRPWTQVSATALGWYGRRQWQVDAQGASLWSNNDLFIGGYRIELRYQSRAWWGLSAVWLDDFGRQQNALSHSFQVRGATLGARFQF